jgi:hypothetical protein
MVRKARQPSKLNVLGSNPSGPAILKFKLNITMPKPSHIGCVIGRGCTSLLVYSLLCWIVFSARLFYALNGNAIPEFGNHAFPGENVSPSDLSSQLPKSSSEGKHGSQKLLTFSLK